MQVWRPAAIHVRGAERRNLITGRDGATDRESDKRLGSNVRIM
jgi:hypothetical protein